MFKKLTYAVSISALAALSLSALVAASGSDYANFTIANGDPNEEGQRVETKVQSAIFVPQPQMLNIGNGDDSDSFEVSRDYSKFTIANGDPNEEQGGVTGSKVQAALVVEEPVRPNIGAGDDSDKATGSLVKLNIGASDPAEQD
jgi:hypothetical protein